MLLLRGIHYGGAADLGQLPALAIERPAADFIPYDILNEEDSAVEAEGELVKELNVLQQVVIRVTATQRQRQEVFCAGCQAATSTERRCLSPSAPSTAPTAGYKQAVTHCHMLPRKERATANFRYK